jgi:hypothetical protein
MSFPAFVLTLPAVDLCESSYARTFSQGVASGSRFPGALDVNNTASAFYEVTPVTPPTSRSAFGGLVVFESQPSDELMSADATLPVEGGSSFPLHLEQGAFGGDVLCGSHPEDVPMLIDHPLPTFDGGSSSLFPASSRFFAIHGQRVEDIMMLNDDAGPTSSGM